MGCCSPKAQKWTAFSVSLFFIVLGTLTVIFWGPLFDSILKKELSLESTRSEGFLMWKETPIPMYMKFYLWNFTNADEVVKSKWTIKPILEQCGPYVYYEHHIRENVTFNDNNNTVTYKTRRVWHYRPEMTNGSLEDKITTINPIVATAAYFIRLKHYLVRKAFSILMDEKREQIIVTKTVDEFLFKGYEDPLLDLLKKLHMKDLNLPFTNFGWFANRNNSIDYDGVYNMYTGTDDIEKLGRILAWNYDTSVPYYDGECGKVQGTTGELWYPPKDDKKIKVFANDICSTIELEFQDTDELNGIQGHRYVAQSSIFDNGTKYPEMACYKPKEVHLDSGVRNVSECKFHAPAFVSFPHYYLADPSYSEPIEGMNPDPNMHQFYMALEPSTGLPLYVHAAIQVNLKIEAIEGIAKLKEVKTMYLPMLWFEQTAELSKALSNQAKILLVLPSVGHYTGYGIIVIGFCLVFLALYLTLKNTWHVSGDEERLINQQSF